jgi:hypothetical protein
MTKEELIFDTALKLVEHALSGGSSLVGLGSIAVSEATMMIEESGVPVETNE